MTRTRVPSVLRAADADPALLAFLGECGQFVAAHWPDRCPLCGGAGLVSVAGVECRCAECRGTGERQEGERA